MKQRFNIDKMGVLVLLSHLLITLAMIVIYALFAWLGKPVATVENMLLIIMGYWFGAIGSNSIRPPKDNDDVNKDVNK